MRQALRSAALVIGLGLTVLGLFAVGTYVAGVIDIFVERPADRSWLFWGLAVAGLGVVALGSGITLLIIWRQTRNGSKGSQTG